MSDTPQVREGDKVFFRVSGTEATVTDVYHDGSFIVEWRGSRGKCGQIFSPSVFTRDGRHVDHRPQERHEQAKLTEATA